MKDQDIKSILVHFFREATDGDYLHSLNIAIKEIKALHASECKSIDSDLRAKIDAIYTNTKRRDSRGPG